MTVLHIPGEAVAELEALVRTDDGSVTGELLTVAVEPWDVRFTGAD